MAGGMILASWLAVSHALVLPQPIGHQIAMRPGRAFAAVMREPSTEPAESQGAFQGIVSRLKGSVVPVMNGAAAEGEADKQSKEGEGMTLEKVASFGIAGVLSIAVAETVFWVLSFPTSELLYFVSTGEWIDLWSQEGQLKFLAFTAGWGALGGAIAQYRTVLTAAAMTPWMDANVVKPYINPLLEGFGKEQGD